jgi:MFS transporter, ACS family, hexuronate transporter
MTEKPTGMAGSSHGSVGWFRWVICGLLFLATTINYIDRQIISILKKPLEEQFHWSETDFANIVFAFQLAYAAGYFLGGRLMDLIGVRRGYALAVMLWSLAAIGHALNQHILPGARFHIGVSQGLEASRDLLWVVPLSVLGFCTARFGLGLAEGGNFPAAVKAVGEWFPARERALATGIFNAGSNVGAVVTPLLVPWMARHWGWPTAFWVTGSLGFLWLVCWWLLYQAPQQHPRLSRAELAYIRSDPPDPPARIAWLELLRHRQTWAFAAGMFLSSPIWWMYLYWVPDFFYKHHGIDLKTIGPPLVTIYLMADVGSIGGGWLSSWLMKRGWSVNAGRKTAMLVCALCVVPIFLASQVSGLWAATFLIGLAASAHQGFSANLYTLVSDTMPRQAVSSVVGIGGMAGAIGGMFIAKFMGYILDTTHSYLIPFAIPGFAYLTALAIIHLLLPKLEPMKLKPRASTGAPPSDTLDP